MDTETIKTWFKQYVEEAWNKPDMDLLKEFWHPEFTNHYAPEFPPGHEGMLQQARPFFQAFSDIHFLLDDILVEGDKIAVRLTINLTHTGKFMGIAPTGKRVTFREFAWYRLKDDKLCDIWPLMDYATLLDQLRGA